MRRSIRRRNAPRRLPDDLQEVRQGKASILVLIERPSCRNIDFRDRLSRDREHVLNVDTVIMIHR